MGPDYVGPAEVRDLWLACAPELLLPHAWHNSRRGVHHSAAANWPLAPLR